MLTTEQSLSQQAASILFNSSNTRATNVFARSSSTEKSPNPRFSRFEELLATTEMPPSGPEYYAARRKLWLKPGWEGTPKPRPHSNSRQKLEAILNQTNALYDDNAWKKIDRVWKNLANGTRLSERLPMGLIIKIVHAAWVRDHTWPAGFEAPEPDDVAPPEDDTVSDLQLNSLQGDGCVDSMK
ncbi:hypothetical protein DFP72DRAFT_877960 [Ephemerocybe angulata]|uniref:DUF4050 domain-containing protein n=1 Tax=Ephemerocybe angulata TaxID=980116 RepID=A0A8H6IAU7_9AGAR|nr:hypothetical protein DFP72DRAFT_877960 [Tulosesus angulatus]